MASSNISFFDKLSPTSPHPPSSIRGVRSPGNRSNRTSQSKRSQKSSRSNASRASLQSTDSSQISVIIGKTFEATTLPDGSQQILEATKYKRLSDGYIYQETKMRSLEDDGDGNVVNVMAPPQSTTPMEEDESRDDDIPTNVGRGSDAAQFGPPPSVRRQSAGGGRTPPTKDGFGDYPVPQDSLLSTFSSSGSFSSGAVSPDNATKDFVSVVTEDHGFTSGLTNPSNIEGGTSPRQQAFVEEYLYDNDPVGLQQWKETQAWTSRWSNKKSRTANESQALSPTSATSTPKGWCANYDKNSDSDDNSLQLMKAQRSTRMASLFWSPRTNRAAAAVRNFFPSTPKDSKSKCSKSSDRDGGCPLDIHAGGSSGGTGSGGWEDEEQGGLGVLKTKSSCHDRMRTRRCKVLIFGIVMVVIGTIAAAVVLTTGVPGALTNESVDEQPMEYIDTEEKKTDVSAEEIGGEDEVSPGSEDVSTDEVPPKQSAGVEEVSTDEVPSKPIQDGDDTKAVVPVAPSKPSDGQPSCIGLEIVMSSNDSNADDTNSWSLTRIGNDGETVTLISSDLLPEEEESDRPNSNGNTEHVYKHCVKPGVYTFTIADSSGNGLGSEGSGGYYIQAQGVTLGISSFFFHEEKMTFTLPFDAEEGTNDKVDGDTGYGNVDTVCTDDFFLAIKTDKYPEQTRWNVVDNESGNQVLTGGPYELPWAVYTRRACLPNGNYTFSMLDDGGDGICCDTGKGFFVLSKDGETIVSSDGQFGNETSTVFLLGDDDNDRR